MDEMTRDLLEQLQQTVSTLRILSEDDAAMEALAKCSVEDNEFSHADIITSVLTNVADFNAKYHLGGPAQSGL